jgi:hypothetical protein
MAKSQKPGKKKGNCKYSALAEIVATMLYQCRPTPESLHYYFFRGIYTTFPAMTQSSHDESN